jgi:DNA repair exonuclease SbcCD ATPase subunit
VAFLNEIRLRIKTYLVPSLSRVASHLLTQMTGGERSSIEVNENFDILVDGQRLDTLSGSGKACANLALRIGLGQVLTNNVLSIFIGDEIDASMDQNRADFTQNSLGSLTNQISQIFLVTHKIPSADHVVRLEG